MKKTRTATAHWTGSGKEGKGHLSTASGALDQTAYDTRSRFEEGKLANPEELIGAAHAGCFSMKLAFNLQEAGYTADDINTTAKVTIDNGEITEIFLDTKVKVQQLNEEEFMKLAEHAKENCPVSKLMNAKISLTAALE